MFVQAINNTPATAPSKMRSDLREFCEICPVNEASVALRPLSVAGYSEAMRAVSRLISACASGSETPGVKRAISPRNPDRRGAS